MSSNSNGIKPGININENLGNSQMHRNEISDI